ncbi:hypothetical protein [Microbacterium sp. T32]|uniref:hypothetical protein n=1 Tax=Microbacterium sp. T32 TaxID=1776083 RepID=UPI0007ABD335|nr:hypothetical protein [Microbacterium sp. T32]KZE41548.1 hypothetical protein AVW09_02875 [Microbacterium sp. T32]
MKTIRAPFAVGAAAALLLLAGCSGGGSAPDQGDAAAPSSAASSAPSAAAPVAEQSKADACKIIIDSFTDVSQASSSMSTSDPAAAMATFKELVTKVQGDFQGITNTEIAPAAQDASTTLSNYVAFLEQVTADPSKASELGDQVTALQNSFSAAGKACEG